MKKLEILFGILRLPIDAAAVTLALILSYHLRERSVDLIPGVQLLEAPSTLPALPDYVSTFIIPSIALFILVALGMRLYSFRITGSAWAEMGRTIVAAALWLVLVMAWFFFVRKQLFYSRILLIHATFFTALFVMFGRACATVIHRWMLRLGYGVRYVASIGSKALPKSAKLTLDRDLRYRYLGHLSSLEALEKLNGKESIDMVIQTDAAATGEQTMMLAEYCRNEHIGFAFLPPVFADAPHLLVVERLGLLPMIRFQPTPLDGWGRVFKRVFDLVLSVISIVMLSPLFLLVALAILIESGRPIFYISSRVGAEGRRRIPVLKFRTMVRNADERKAELLEQNQRRDGPLFKIKDDPRITRVGRILRRWSVDELPQLFNVAVGHLSLVGPRPHLPDEVKLYAPHQKRVFAVWPGVTGLAQISGRSDLKFEEEVRLDLQYIEEWSIRLDLWILWRTIFVVFSKKGAD